MFSPKPTLQNECQVRNYYAQNINSFRDKERVLATEQRILGTNLRTDMKTIDENNVMRLWEFKIVADHHVLGQILPYMALSRRIHRKIPIRGVIAAFDFSDELLYTNEALNLNLELVFLPKSLTIDIWKNELKEPFVPSIPFEPVI